MIIRSSSTPEVTRLLIELAGSDDARREAAVARLAIIGQRAVGRLLDLLAAAPTPDARTGALRALEAIGDLRGLDRARQLVDDPDDAVAMAALAVVCRHLQSPDEAAGARALDTVTGTALDANRSERLRLAALTALGDMPRALVDPIFARLADDPDPLVRERLAGGGPPPAETGSLLDRAAAGSFSDAPAALRTAIVEEAPEAPLALLGRLVDSLGVREAGEPDRERRAGWTAARGALHQALAARGSRLALYDLRESFERTTDPLPVSFLAAMEAVGDSSCLDALAGAWARSGGAEHDWWRDHLRQTFRLIARRERLTGRHRIMRRIREKWPESASALLGAPRNR